MFKQRERAKKKDQTQQNRNNKIQTRKRERKKKEKKPKQKQENVSVTQVVFHPLSLSLFFISSPISEGEREAQGICLINKKWKIVSARVMSCCNFQTKLNKEKKKQQKKYLKKLNFAKLHLLDALTFATGLIILKEREAEKEKETKW